MPLQPEKSESGPQSAGEGGSATAPAVAGLIDERIRSLGGWRAVTLAEVRRLIHEVDPEFIEECKWVKVSNPMGVPVWSHAGIVCTGEAYKLRSPRGRLTCLCGWKSGARAAGSLVDRGRAPWIDMHVHA